MKVIKSINSRRAFLRLSTICLVAAPGLAAVGTAHANKADKVDLAYRDKPGAGGKSCSTCASFVAPKGCKVVDGEISTQGWCIAYSAAQ